MTNVLKRRKTLAAVGIVLVVLLGPWLWSRFQSTANRIKVIAASDVITAVEKNSLRVACYNIAHGRGLAESNWDGGDAATRLSRLDEIAELLKKLDVDVIVLNEVDFDASWSNRINQAEYLADKAGYPFRVEERNLDFRVLHRTWRFGNAILSRYPISNAKVIDLPSYAAIETALAGKKRGVRCDVAVGKESIRVFGLHLSHRSEDVREHSARDVVKLVNESQIPCIVMGDMNSTPPGFPGSSLASSGENAIQTFDRCEQLYRSEPPQPLNPSDFTYRSDQPKSIIDWIFVSKTLDFQSLVVEGSQLSDHRPVVAEINW